MALLTVNNRSIDLASLCAIVERKKHCELNWTGRESATCMILFLFVFIYQMLNDHCIVRIGGGWDTLEHYIMTHLAKVGKCNLN